MSPPIADEPAGIDHWSQWVVLGGIIATVIGFMIAVSPNRRGA